ncbi:MAG: hypothetical protein QXJ19_02250 [Candidatus Bathyarchaeia archaeon]
MEIINEIRKISLMSISNPPLNAPTTILNFCLSEELENFRDYLDKLINVTLKGEGIKSI